MDDLIDPQFKTKDGSALRIWRDSVQNRFLSEREGRPIYDEAIFCEVISPGSRDSTPQFELVRNFAPEMKHPDPIYGPKYEELKEFVASFVKDEEIDKSLTGTPLEQWPEMTRSLRATLRSQNIFTVDALAELPDTKLLVVGPDGRTWRTKAIAYIENAKGNAYATKLAATVERLTDDLRASEERALALSAQVEALQRASATPEAPQAPVEAPQPPVEAPQAPAEPIPTPKAPEPPTPPAEPLAAPEVVQPAAPAMPII